jgi:hypothetical protein
VANRCANNAEAILRGWGAQFLIVLLNEREDTMGLHDSETEITHPSFGVLQVSRVTGYTKLFASDFKHRHFITLTLRRARVRRDFSRDWIFSSIDDEFTLYMSEAQWAHFVSSFNDGSGVPVTIKSTRDGNRVSVDEPPASGVGSRQSFIDEFQEMCKRAGQHLNLALEMLRNMARGNLGLSKTNLATLQKTVELAKQSISSDLPFVEEQFESHLDTLIANAKAEVNAHNAMRVMELGIAALGNTITPEQRQLLLQKLDASDTPTVELGSGLNKGGGDATE